MTRRPMVVSGGEAAKGGRSPVPGSGHSPKGGAAKASPAKPSVPNAALVELIEASSDLGSSSIHEINGLIHDTLPEPKVICPPDYLRSLDAALTLLPAGAVWRKYTDVSVSVYAASPYSANAQVRHDGYGSTPAAQLCAARFKMLAAIDRKAELDKSRRESAQ
jgi:hypothetical protein